MTTLVSSDDISTWRSRLHAFGPGLMMASAAIGGSHLISSTQAGALYGWQLAVIIVLANLLKYPFFRFSAHYTLDTGKSLIEGYAGKSRAYVWVFLLLTIPSATISTGALALISASIIKTALPALPLSVHALSICVMAASLAILLFGHYRALDRVTKLIMVSLTIATIGATFIAASRGHQMLPDFIEPSPWNMASLGFIIALMGWMPAPMEITAINSMWVSVKQKLKPSNYRDAMFDFNVGYTVSAGLAIVFLALGALVQYGNGEEVKMAGGQYIGQLIGMYAATIGDWSKLLVAFIAFACMFGSTITVADGYGRINAEAIRLLARKSGSSKGAVSLWTCWSALSGLAVILWFNSALSEMLRFAMISAFLTAPVFAWLNYSLVRSTHRTAISPRLNALAVIGLLYLIGFAIVFVFDLFGVWAR
ncbi:Mn2+ and Fe2+ transporters of the NRAMP family [Pasteurella testudinis DSM 23072]|uniref:Mn2+ and Fe2+ transporters of the NRAMP family n=1 Tax=Pasteurella testudinis DSM 23072 TaxID=1122938 RepID=A0A1W1UMM2_9PAST|nr:NRAMP family divalent metal transporter [Pasteurella testudinis]SMB82051.1 Mn2+ and Fe2+ transporters of the NRAMP family [Pasteurella testudinis DSM 23072]SUB52377.1 putative transmembrane protein [Pasteurella testudinis]